MRIYEVVINYTNAIGIDDRDGRYFFHREDAEAYMKEAEKKYFHNSPLIFLNHVKVEGIQ
jgi:hypothetical protein